MRPNRPPLPPLDAPALDRLALRYVERFATTRKRLADYLDRKIRARGWEGTPPDTRVIADRFAELGYVDDRAFGAARASAMARRGLGARRVAGALYHAGVGGDDAVALRDDIDARALEAALAFARKRRIGPFAAERADRLLQQKQLGAMLRGGHDLATARRIIAMAPGDDPETLESLD